jgi:SM-20-related protein|tara:strand:+ start:85 stop:657 length:573 start_codon:yes stop_codon:yes gene_type:complete
MSIIKIIDNVAPPEIFTLVVEELKKGIWTFDNSSIPEDINNSFGASDYTNKINSLLEKNEFNKSNIFFNLWNSINDKINIEKNYKNTLKRIHLNGGPPLFDQTIHQDDMATFSRNITIVFFAHEEWNISWGGELLVYDMLKTTVTAGAFPRPNRAVIFPSYLPHRGVAVSRICPTMRISVAFQCTFNNTL